MRLSFAAAGAMLLCTGATAFAHRLDEYLQATMLSVANDRIEAQIRLTPGVAIFPAVFATIDRNGDGLISDAERTAYAERVLRDLSFTMDGHALALRLVSAKIPRTEQMKEGLGEIQLELRADVPRGGPNRRLVFKNHHQSGFSAYLVNTVVPGDLRIRMGAQNRNQDQSVYQLDYVQAGGPSGPMSFAWWSGDRMWTGAAALLLLARLIWVWRTGAWRMRPPATASSQGQRTNL
jgi:hypothetical protein